MRTPDSDRDDFDSPVAGGGQRGGRVPVPVRLLLNLVVGDHAMLGLVLGHQTAQHGQSLIPVTTLSHRLADLLADRA